MKNINYNEFYKNLSNFNGGTFVSITTNTIVEMKKTDNPLADAVVTKLSVRTSYQFGCSYKSIIDKRLKAQGICEKPNFIPQAPKGRVWDVTNRILVDDKGLGIYYARFYRTENSKEVNTYFVNGVEATAEQVELIKQFKKSHSYTSKSQSEAGLETHQAQPLDLKFQSIVSIRVDNEEYVINHNDTTISHDVAEVA